jgi:transposase-like protein
MKEFNFNEALEMLEQGQPVDGKDGVLAPLIKELVEAALEAETESHLSQELRKRKNGKSSKQMKSFVGEFGLNVPHCKIYPQQARETRRLKRLKSPLRYREYSQYTTQAGRPAI